jgi:tetratricopeptide (TPR) repeat protein
MRKQDTSEWFRALETLAHAYEVRGKFDAMQRTIEYTLALAERQDGLSRPVIAAWVYYLGVCRQLQGNAEQAAGYYQQALATLQTTLGPEHEHTRIVRHALETI